MAARSATEGDASAISRGVCVLSLVLSVNSQKKRDAWWESENEKLSPGQFKIEARIRDAETHKVGKSDVVMFRDRDPPNPEITV